MLLSDALLGDCLEANLLPLAKLRNENARAVCLMLQHARAVFHVAINRYHIWISECLKKKEGRVSGKDQRGKKYNCSEIVPEDRVL